MKASSPPLLPQLSSDSLPSLLLSEPSLRSGSTSHDMRRTRSPGGQRSDCEWHCSAVSLWPLTLHISGASIVGGLEESHVRLSHAHRAQLLRAQHCRPDILCRLLLHLLRADSHMVASTLGLPLPACPPHRPASLSRTQHTECPPGPQQGQGGGRKQEARHRGGGVSWLTGPACRQGCSVMCRCAGIPSHTCTASAEQGHQSLR